MIASRAVLFPHSHIPEQALHSALAHFEWLTVCQPWYMDRPVSKTNARKISHVNIVYPPPSLKPRNDFKPLLAEYLEWMRQHQDRGLTTFLQAIQDLSSPDEAGWQIRKRIRKFGSQTPMPQEGDALRWHLILHLARKLEELRAEADQLLRDIKLQPSPLADAIGEDPPQQGPLMDLPGPEEQSSLDPSFLRRVFEAWFGLFGAIIKDFRFLVTFDRHVPEYAAQLFGDRHTSSRSEERDPPLLDSISTGVIFEFQKYTGISGEGNAMNDRVIAGLSERAVVLLEGS
jgi:hypothetical protein